MLLLLYCLAVKGKLTLVKRLPRVGFESAYQHPSIFIPIPIPMLNPQVLIEVSLTSI